MSDFDTELTRLFAEAPAAAPDETFVRRVAARIVRHKWTVRAIPVAAAALLLVAIWMTWPIARIFSDRALDGIVLLAQGASAFFNSPIGVTTAGALIASGMLWAWLDEWMRRTS